MEEKKLQELKKILAERGLKNKDVAALVGCTPQMVSTMLTGRRKFGADTAKRWSEALGISPMMLMFGEDGVGEVTGDSIMIPLINLDAKGGDGSNDVVDTGQYIERYLPFDRTIARDGDFAMRIYNNSMAPDFPSGSVVVVRPIEMWREYLELGAPYIIDIKDGRRVCKVVCAGSDNEHWLLKSCNPEYQPSELPMSMVMHIGRVIASLKIETL